MAKTAPRAPLANLFAGATSSNLKRSVFESELNSLLKELAPRHEAANEKALKRSRR